MVVIIIIYDFECFKHDWLVCWLDTETKEIYSIVNDRVKFQKFYEYYKNRIWVGYNSRNYDQWIAKSILADFNPYEMSEWIIKKERKGFEFSNLLNSFYIINYDCSVFGRSLKQLEGFMGHDIQESDVPFDIDRKLTDKELKSVIQYCKHDVWETFEVFVKNKNEFEEHMGLIQEFELPIYNVSKTSTQLASIILGAVSKKRDDEFDIRIADTVDIKKYKHIPERFLEWSKFEKDYKTMKFETYVLGVKHVFGVGGIHGAKKNYIDEGLFLMADVGSYYASLMIEYDMLSRNVSNKTKFSQIRDKRFEYKMAKNPKHKSLKLVLNKTYGGSKDQYNSLYDPQQANNVCISGQLLLVDLLEKLEGHCDLVQSNTDGVLLKVYSYEELEVVKQICEDWKKRSRMTLEYCNVKAVIQKDVNNYIIVLNDGTIKRKGMYVKELNDLDYDLAIVNEAVVNYFIKGIIPRKTIMECDDYIKFQMITKIGKPYEYTFHNDKVLTTRVNRVFASKDKNDSTLYKKKTIKDSHDKVASTPEHCYIDNRNIVEKKIPTKLDKEWYIKLAESRIDDFLTGT